MRTVTLGPLLDYFSTNRTPFLLGLFVTFFSTFLFALGTTIPILLSARLLEGLSTAVVATVGSALLREIVPSEHLGRAMGYTSMALSMGLLSGPVIGGLLYEYAGYFATFVPALCLVGLETVLRIMIVEQEKGKPERSHHQQKRDDEDVEVGKGETTNCSDSHDIGLEGAMQEEMCTSGLHDRQQHESQPLLTQEMVPVLSTKPNYHILFNEPRFLVAATASFLLNTIINAFDAVLVPYISDTFSLGPIHAAALFMCLAIPMLFSPLMGSIADARGTKLVAAAGLVLEALTLGALSLVGHDTTQHPMLVLGALFAALGIAMSSSTVSLRLEISRVVDDACFQGQEESRSNSKALFARATGFVNATLAAGGMLGPLAGGWLRLGVGWCGMALIMAGTCVVLLGFVVRFTGSSAGQESTESI